MATNYHTGWPTRRFDVGAQQLNVLDTGHGDQTVVLIHGNSSSIKSFQHQVGHLVSRYRVVAIDLPGHGESDNAPSPDDTYTIDGYADILGLALQALGIGSPIIVGWSLGGHIALSMLAAGQRASGLLLTGTPPIDLGAVDFEAAFFPDPSGGAVGNPEPTSEQLTRYAELLFGEHRDIPAALVADVGRTDGVARLRMAMHWLAGEGRHSQKHYVANTDIPIAVVHGEDDAFVPLSFIREQTWSSMWRKEVQVIANVGHAPFFEAPSEFNRILDAFLNDLALAN